MRRRSVRRSARRSVRRSVRLVVLVPLVLPLAAAAAEGDSEMFSFRELAFPERMVGRALADLDGDGRLDLTMIHEAGDTPPSWRVRTCLQGETGAFATCAVRALPPAARGFDVCSFGRRAATVVLLTEDGALAMPFLEGAIGAPTPMPHVRSLLAGSDAGVPVRVRVCFDANGDGRDEWLVAPTAGGPVLHRTDATGPGPGQALESPPRVTYHQALGELEAELFRGRTGHGQSLQARTTTPSLFVEDFDGDGRRDLVTVLDNEVRIFRQGRDGSLASAPTRVVSRGDPEAQREDESAGEATSFADLDGDGRADLVVTRYGGEKLTRIDRLLYYAREDGTFPEEPDQVVRSEAFFPAFAMHDLDADGRRELVVPYFHVAPAQAVRVLTQNALKIQFRIFRMRPEGRYGQDEGRSFAKVDGRVVFEYELDFLGLLFRPEERPEGPLAPFIVVEADVNGDGYADFLADDGGDRLGIRFGNAQARYAGSADATVDLESAWAFDVVDANGDGRSDVFTWYGPGHVREQVEPLPAGKAARKRASQQRREDAAGAPVGPLPAKTRVKVLLSR